MRRSRIISFALLHSIAGSSAFLPTTTIDTAATTTTFTSSSNVRTNQILTQLDAKQTKNKKKKRATRNTIGNRTQSSSGFGGASIAPCPCGAKGDDGSQKVYMKCCGLLHSSADKYASAKAEQVVRARYSAYAKRQVCFVLYCTVQHCTVLFRTPFKFKMREICPFLCLKFEIKIYF